MSLYDLNVAYGDSLISREGNGIFVAVFYDRANEEAYVHYQNDNTGEAFTLNPPKFLALDCYMHPIPYRDAAMRGIANPFRLVPAGVDYVA